jgi:hypothetical protein
LSKTVSSKISRNVFYQLKTIVIIILIVISTQPERVYIRHRLPVAICVSVEALVVLDVPQQHILVDEPVYSWIIVPRPHVVQTISVGYHAFLPVIEERSICAAGSVHQFAVGGVLEGVFCLVATSIGQGNGVASIVEVVGQVLLLGSY